MALLEGVWGASIKVASINIMRLCEVMCRVSKYINFGEKHYI